MHKDFYKESSRCYFNRPTLKDKQDIADLYANKDVRKFLGGVVINDAFEEKFNQILASSTINWVVRLKETDSFIGMINIDRHQDGKDHEISYQIMPDFWGSGLSKEVISVALDFSHQEMHLKRIVAETQVKNIASRKLLEKLGMKAGEEVIRFGEEQIIYFKDFQFILINE